MYPEVKGRRIGVITHAGGPAVMLTDALTKGGLIVPPVSGKKADELKEKLFHGSSVTNPFDFLATGTAEQLGYIIDACENDFENIDAMAVIFGSPGLFSVTDVYDILDKKMKSCRKPVFPILPSVINVKEDINAFIDKGNINFPEEVVFANALVKVLNTPHPEKVEVALRASSNTTFKIKKSKIRTIIDRSSNGYLDPLDVSSLLDAAGIPRVAEAISIDVEEALRASSTMGFPVAMKVVGPVHKSDVGGVVLNIADKATVTSAFRKMMKIPGAKAVFIQKMVTGTELFAGVKAEGSFGHLLLTGLGGIFIEVIKDVSASLIPVSHTSAMEMIHSLKSYAIIKGFRGKQGINESVYADIICRLSALIEAAPEIFELDLNPLIATADSILAVDARIRIEKR
jgi:acetyltransferase